VFIGKAYQMILQEEQIRIQELTFSKHKQSRLPPPLAMQGYQTRIEG